MGIEEHGEAAEVEVLGTDGDMAHALLFESFHGSIADRPVEPVLVRMERP